MPARPRRKLIAGWLLALTAMAVMAMPPGAAHANSRVGELVRRTAGPYEIALGTIPDRPVVGLLHATMTVADLSSGRFVLDADVTVTGRGPEGEAIEIGPLEVRNNPTDSTFYEVNARVDRVGTWTFTVSVSSDLGQASADFAIKVRTESPIFKLLTWVTAAVFFALVGLGLLPYIRGKSKRCRVKRHGS